VKILEMKLFLSFCQKHTKKDVLQIKIRRKLILKRILKKQCVKMWSGFTWFWIRSNGGLL
jgi:hypothetical protein